MRRSRFYASPEAFTSAGSGGGGMSVMLAAEEARHLRDVLRLKLGDEAYVFDGEGQEYLCHVTKLGGRGSDAATLGVAESVSPANPESPLHLTLAVALLKGEKFDLCVQKATELGVCRVMPVITKRADVRLRDSDDAAKRTARWRRLAVEAAKQSGRACVPEIVPPLHFKTLIEEPDAENDKLRLMFAERMGGNLAEVLSPQDRRTGLPPHTAPTSPTSVTALVGPEGGWEDEEIIYASETGWTIITLGGRTLRAETAAITVTGLLQHLFGDLV